MLQTNKQTDRETDKQTDSNVLSMPTPTDRVSVVTIDYSCVRSEPKVKTKHSVKTDLSHDKSVGPSQHCVY